MKTLRGSKIPLLLISLLWMMGCNLTSGITPAAPTASSMEIITPLPSPTVEPVSPTASTPEPLVSPAEPSLRTNGPYFAYFRNIDGVNQFVMMDADGGGRKAINLPDDIGDVDMKFVSPDGHWLAFYTGSAGTYGTLPAEGTADLTLNLLDLDTGETQIVTPLLSKDYPNNFTEAATSLNDPYKTPETLFDAFVNGITQAISWSPDGRYLAFAGQMDGLSSDLYVYDVETQQITRLSSGDQELQWISWSPDEKRIVHGAVFGAGAGMTYDIYVASLDGSAVPYISTNVLSSGVAEWLNAHQYFESDGANGPGSYGLRLVDIDTGAITKIWDGSFGSYAVDKTGTWIMLLANSPDTSPYSGGVFNFDPNFVSSFYLVNLKTHTKSKVEVSDNVFVTSTVQSFGVAGQDFVLTDQATNSPVFFSVNGTWTPTDLGDVQISASPDSKYWLALGEEINIFSAENTLTGTNPMPISNDYLNFSWRPDSAGVFLITGSEISALSVPDGNVQLAETNLLENQNYAVMYGWIMSQ